MAEKNTLFPAARVSGPELRLLDRRAFVGFPELVLAPGIVITDFALQIPDVTFPLNLSGGPSKYQKKKLDFGLLEVAIDAEVLQREVRSVSAKLPELDEVRLHFRPGHLEIQARLRGPERTPVTFKAAFDGDGERLAVYLYDVRLYSFSTTPAARLGAIVSDAVRELGILPEVERRGANGFTTRILPGLVEQAAVGRGYKMPALDQARLADATVSSKGLRLRFSSGGLPPPGVPDEELMLALEGARAFGDAEELVAQNKLAEAREAYLRLGDATEAHPFAVERLLTLLVADFQAHELVLDIAVSLHRRRDKSATALWAEAVVRERRGEFARASERFLALCSLARKNQEEAGAFFAAEAAARSSREHAPHMAVKALHELLGIKPDHLPSLMALARASDQAKDRAGAIRAYRRLAALARDPQDAAEAHVQLARLCAQTEDDVAGARLHCEAALRLSPDHPDALFQLGELCFRSGEWLRAIKALDRVREVAMGRHEVDRVGRANLLAGQVWETGLKQPENALLRFREAVALLPGEAEPHFRAARVSESLGKLQEAVAGYQQAVELAGPAPRTDEIRAAAHASHHALARLLKTKLGEPARAREHLEAALALDPQDTAALDELLPYFRAAGKVAELADACEKAAALLGEPSRRAALWAEAGELYRGRLNQPDKAERLLFLALEADPNNRLALEGLLALAESKRDGGQLCHCLKTLAELVVEPQEKVRHYRRLIVAARDLAFDLDLAVFAARQVLKEEPEDLPVLGELTALERRRSDMGGLAWALEHRARVAENTGDKRLAAAALRELSTLLDTRLGRAGEALVALEKATRLSPDVNALLDLATLASRLERPQQARRALEDVLSLLPRHAPPEKLAEVRTRLARTCEDLGDKEAARAQYALAFPLRRLDDELAARLDALYAETQSTRERIELWATRAQALHQAGRGPEGAQLLVQAAALLLDLGDAPQAILRLQAALEMAPAAAQAGAALELLGRLELERGAVAEAARLYARRAQLESDAALSARWYFKASSLAVDTPREQEWLALALERDSTLIAARLRRAHLNESQRPHEALADFEAVLQACIEAEAAPNEALAALKLDVPSVARRAAVVAQKCGQPAAALRWWAVYAAQHPEDVDAQLELANLYRHEGATEALMAVLGQLWPRLTGVARQSARREFIEGALSLGRVAEAIQALRAHLVEQPADGWAAARLLPLLPLDEGSRDERLSLLSRLIDEASAGTRAELLAQRAEIYRAAGDFERLRQDLLEASRVSPHPLPLLRALVDLSAERGDDATEIEAWEGILALNGHEAGWVQESILRLPFIAQRRTAAGELPLARRAFALLSTLPLPPEIAQQVHLGLARIAVVQGEVHAAAQAFKSAATVGPVPQRVAVWLERASFARSRGLGDLAIESYEAGLALSPRHPQATQGLIEALREASDWEGLAEILTSEAAHLPGPQALPLFRELASLHLEKLSLPGPAEVALRRVATLDPRDAQARLQLAQLLVVREQWQDAVQAMEQAAELLPSEQAAAVLRQAAELAQRLDDASLSLRLMRRAHVLVPANGDDLERLADALYLHGAVREALPLQQAWASSLSFHDAPDVAERAWLRLADLGEQLGDRQLAESSLRRVVSERPLNGQAVERLAQVLEGQAGFELRSNWAKTLSPSARTQELLLSLGREAVRQYRDVEGALRLYAKATSMAQSPLPIRLEVASVLRDGGRTAELMAELAEIAQLQLTGGQVDGALAAWDEESRLAEGSGRIDDALRTLSAMAELCAEEGRATEATGILLRRAELLSSAKLDLVGAIDALEKAWELAPTQEIARQGLALAARRSDRDGEIDWHERLLTQLVGDAQAHGFVQLARLHLGLSREVGGEVATASLVAVDQAEAALHRALTLAPGLAEAEQLLMALYERQDRPGDMAAYYEAQAHKEQEASRRSSLLLRAAQLYKDKAARPHDAAAALLAARAANPDDDTLTTRVADLLIDLGHRQDAADFDALVLEKNPLHPAFERHAEYLTQSGDHLALAGLLSMRAEASTGADAAQLWLQAADAFHRGEAHERAHVCEGQALETQPHNQLAFERLFQHAAGEPRRQAELLAQRARVAPAEALNLWRQRAELLTAAGDALWAASAWDDVLAVSPDDVAALEARGTLAAAAVGARAAQPFDRRLVQVAGESLPPATLAVVWSRLGHAALESQAWHDAVDAFETVLRQSPTEERAKEALSLLNEAYAHLGDRAGQYRACVRLAQSTQGEEAEALYRRALALQDDPAAGTEALEWLVSRHPGEVELYEKAQQAFRALWRWRDLVSLAERYAAAVGGPAAAKALLMAAFICETELHEGQRAFELRDAAYEANPNDVEAAETLLNEVRRRADEERLELMLVRLSSTTTDEQLAAELKLELATLRIARGQFEAAREPLETIFYRGPSGPGYAQALTTLERVATELHDAATLAQVQVASAELLGPQQRAARLLEAARTSVEAGQVEPALQLTKSSLAVRPSPEGYALLVQLTKEAGHPEAWAQALMQLSEQTEGAARAALWLDAMQAWQAAGQPEAALELLERLRRDFPGHLSESEIGRWFMELGAPARAMAVAFEPALQAGRYDEAVALATHAGDAPNVQRALAAQAQVSPNSDAAARYLELLRSARDGSGLLRYAESIEATAPEMALALRLELAVEFGQLEQIETLAQGSSAEALAQRALAVNAVDVLVRLLPVAEQLSVPTREALFDAVATLAPNRRAPMLRALASLRRSEGRFAEALENLSELASLEELAPVRAAIHIERGELLLRQLHEPRLAQAAFERALLEDPNQLAAVRELVELYQGQQPEQFMAMVERLRELAGPEAVARWREPLALAYEAQGRIKEAYALWVQVEETPERLRHRVQLAEQLGLTGEALTLAEKVADSRAEKERILEGYLRTDLVPFAVRLGQQLIDESPLPPSLSRLLAERLAPTRQGAALAAKVWPALLAGNPNDADGWTLLAEALRMVDRPAAAALADAFGAGLTSSKAPAPVSSLAPLRWEPTAWPVPENALPVSEATMPRLAAVLTEALEGLGASGTNVLLDVTGGVEAWLAQGHQLVLGAGALTAFRPPELVALVALALALGERGNALTRRGEIPEFFEAVSTAMTACPSALAMLRVVAHLDESVRGTDPLRVDVGEVLRRSATFQKLARSVVDALGAPVTGVTG